MGCRITESHHVRGEPGNDADPRRHQAGQQPSRPASAHPNGITILTAQPTPERLRRLHALLAYGHTLQDIAEDLCCQSDEMCAIARALRHKSNAVRAVLAQRRGQGPDGRRVHTTRDPNTPEQG